MRGRKRYFFSGEENLFMEFIINLFSGEEYDINKNYNLVVMN